MSPWAKKPMAARKGVRFPKRLALFAIALTIFVLSLRWLGSGVTTSPEYAGKTSHAGANQRIAIVTYTTSEKSYTHLSLRNKKAYAKAHGYDFVVDFETFEKKGVLWHKFTMIEELIHAGNHDWIWWIDFDTLITNTTIKLSDIIAESLENQTRPDEVHSLLTADCFPLNSGSMLIRSCQASLDFLDRVKAYGRKNGDLSEQDAMRDIIEKNLNNEKQQALMIPQYKINAFPEEIRCWDKADRGWERGTFVVHFAGAWAHVKEEDPTGYLMRKYEGEIIWPHHDQV